MLMRTLRGLVLALLPAALAAQDSTKADTSTMTSAQFEASLKYKTGTVPLKDGVATLSLPAGFRYLDPEDTERVLVNAWGNPSGSGTLGMIVPPGMGVTDSASWAVIVSFDEDGYVKDDEAAKINYDDLLKEMQGDTKESNEARAEAGYEPVTLLGWAERPHYDQAAHKLYWAKDLQFGGSPSRTLNYDIRALGRRGVLILSAVATMDQLGTVKEGMQQVLTFASFNEGHRYADFTPGKDKVAAYGIAALVAGKLAAKAGFFKLLIAALVAGKKFVIIGVIALAGLFRKFFRKDPKPTEGGA